MEKEGEDFDSELGIAISLVRKRQPEERDGAFVKDDGEDEEIDGRLAPEPVGSIEGENQGCGGKKAAMTLA